MPWIESHAELRDHPKVDALMDALSITRRDAIGLLHMVWWRALTYAPTGDLSAVRDSAIARWCDWDGDAETLVTGLIDAGFMDADRQLHDWQEYAGRWIDRRESNAARKRAARAARTGATSGGRPPDVAEKSGATGPNRTLTGPDLNPPVVPPAAGNGGQNGAAAPTKPKRGSTGKTSSPERFEPNEADYAAGRDVGLGKPEVDAKVSAMLDHFRAKGEQRADWHATFRTWIRNAVKFDRQHPPGRASPPSRNGHAPPVAASTPAKPQRINWLHKDEPHAT